MTHPSSIPDKVQFTNDEWIKMATLAGFSKDNAASAKIEFEQVLNESKQRRANSERMPPNKIDKALLPIFMAACDFQWQLKSLRQTPELREAYATSFPGKIKPTNKDRTNAARGIRHWAQLLKQANGDRHQASRLFRQFANKPHKNRKDQQLQLVAREMYRLGEKIDASRSRESELFLDRLAADIAEFIEKFQYMTVEAAKRGPPDQVGALIEVMVFMVRDIADGKFNFSKCTGPAEFVRRAIKKLRLNLSDATINNKIKLVLKNVR